MLEKIRSYARYWKRMSENWISDAEAERQAHARHAYAKQLAKEGRTKVSAAELIAEGAKKAKK